MDKQELGARIRARRRELDLSQGELGSLTGMSQAWVSRIEKGQLFPDLGQIEALETTLGPLSGETPPTASVEPPRGPALYRANRLANENAKRRADLALRLEKLQKTEDASNQVLAAERELAAAFVHEFIQQAVELPTHELAGIRELGLDSFVAEDDETQSLIDVRNSVVHQLGLQLNDAVPAESTRRTLVDAAATVAAYTAVESFATTATGTAVVNLGRAAVAGATGAPRVPYAGALSAATGIRAMPSIGLLAAPALIAAGVIVTVQGRRMLARAQDERSQLLAASLELDQLRVVLDEHCSQAETAANLLAHARRFGAGQLKRLREADPAADLELLVKTCALILSLLPLPVVSEPTESAPLGETHRANELALETAEAWLVEVGALE